MELLLVIIPLGVLVSLAFFIYWREPKREKRSDNDNYYMDIDDDIHMVDIIPSLNKKGDDPKPI